MHRMIMHNCLPVKFLVPVLIRNEGREINTWTCNNCGVTLDYVQVQKVQEEHDIRELERMLFLDYIQSPPPVITKDIFEDRYRWLSNS